jgi:HEAT repeat protein
MDQPTRLRWRHIAAAGHTGDVDTAAAALDDVDPTTRLLALGALQRLGRLDDTQIQAAFADTDPGVRRRAVDLAATRPAIDLLGPLHDDDPSVVEHAAWACGEQVTVSDAVLARLIHLAGSSPAALVRESAVAALGAIGDERGLPAVLAGCADTPAIRRRAVLALAPFDGPEIEAAIDTALTDRDWQVRQAADDLRRAASGD